VAVGDLVAERVAVGIHNAATDKWGNLVIGLSANYPCIYSIAIRFQCVESTEGRLILFASAKVAQR
jgi:hypothetical protein